MQSDIITTVHVPRHALTLIAANIFIWIGIYAVIIATISSLMYGIGFALLAGALIVPVLFVCYVLWRFFWWIWAILATCGTLAFLGLLALYPVAATQRVMAGRTVNPLNGFIIALLIITVAALLLWLFRGENNSRQQSTQSDSPFDFSPRNREQSQQPRPVRRNDELSPIEFQNEVARLLIETNPDIDVSVRENQMDIDVFEDGKQIAIVRCKLGKSGAPIAPLFVQEVARLKDRMGLPIAYIATTAQFNSDARQLAQQLDIRIVDGNKIKQHQQKIARK